MILSAGREVAALKKSVSWPETGSLGARQLDTSRNRATKNVNQLTGFRLGALTDRVAKGHGR